MKNFTNTSIQTKEQILGCVVLPSYQLLPLHACKRLMFDGCCGCCHFSECQERQNRQHGQRTLIKEKAVRPHKKGSSTGLSEAMQAILEEVLHRKIAT